MSTCERATTFSTLDLPREFEDLEGLLHADLRAIVAMLTDRAHDRLFLTRKEHARLQAELWNRLAHGISESLDPLQVEYR